MTKSRKILLARLFSFVEPRQICTTGSNDRSLDIDLDYQIDHHFYFRLSL